jgi:hypothetical protein
MTHPLVQQLRFARSEFQRALVGVPEEDAQRRLMPMNCISWIVGHMAWHEQRSWLTRLQGITLIPELNELVANRKPASTPPLTEMWAAWKTITNACDPYLDTFTTEMFQASYLLDGQPADYSTGSVVLRVTYHYWYHTGESMAIRQMLGHQKLPEFVGELHLQAPYQPH